MAASTSPPQSFSPSSLLSSPLPSRPLVRASAAFVSEASCSSGPWQGAVIEGASSPSSFGIGLPSQSTSPIPPATCWVVSDSSSSVSLPPPTSSLGSSSSSFSSSSSSCSKPGGGSTILSSPFSTSFSAIWRRFSLDMAPTTHGEASATHHLNSIRLFLHKNIYGWDVFLNALYYSTPPLPPWTGMFLAQLCLAVLSEVGQPSSTFLTGPKLSVAGYISLLKCLELQRNMERQERDVYHRIISSMSPAQVQLLDACLCRDDLPPMTGANSSTVASLVCLADLTVGEMDTCEAALTKATNELELQSGDVTLLHMKEVQGRLLEHKYRFFEAASLFFELYRTVKGKSKDSVDMADSSLQPCSVVSASSCPSVSSSSPLPCYFPASLHDPSILLRRSLCCLALFCKSHESKYALVTAILQEQDAKSLPIYEVMRKVEKLRIIRINDRMKIQDHLEDYQNRIAKATDTLVHDAVLQHNLVAASKVFKTIHFTTLSLIVGTTTVKVIDVACGMIKDRRLDAQLNDKTGSICFAHPDLQDGEAAWSRQIYSLCSAASATVQSSVDDSVLR